MKVYIYDDRVRIENTDGTVWDFRAEIIDRRSASESTTLVIQDGTIGSESEFGS